VTRLAESQNTLTEAQVKSRPIARSRLKVRAAKVSWQGFKVSDPIVPYEELITREDALMLRTFRIRTE
jgi:hypothetical protein